MIDCGGEILKRRVELVSCYFQHNYGSMLQAYALQEAVKKLGYEAENLCVDGIAKDIRNKKINYYLHQLLDFSIIKEKAGMIRKKWHKKTNREFSHCEAIRHHKFDEFAAEHFNVSAAIDSREKMGEYVRDCAAVIVGSDQLWLPSNITADYYTLRFVPDDVRKSSYATSFGVSSIPERLHKVTASFLRRLQHISVREGRGQELVHDIAGCKAELVCDPTMLFDKEAWSMIIPDYEVINDKYILCYFLGNNSWQRKKARQMQQETGYKIVALKHLDEYIFDDEDFADIAPYDIGPAEFVNLIRHAEYILTDSFHGTVVSAIHGKRFYSFRRFNAGATLSTNSRMDSLFKLMGCPERLLGEDADINTALKQELPVETIWRNIDELRQPSWRYLKRAIEE